jgi:hypothetical protein
MAEGLNTKVEIYGLKEAIKQLNSIEPGLRNQIAKDFRNVAKPVINDALALIPSTVPLSGMARNWTTKSGFKMLPWDAGRKQKISAKINTKKVSEFRGQIRNVGVFNLVYSGSTGTLFDMAANGKLGQALSARYGRRSRVMWKAMEKNQGTVESEMRRIVETVMDKVDRNVVS